MPASRVSFPLPLTRQSAFYPGQFGVPGTDHDRGLRLHSTGEVFWVDLNHGDTSNQRDGTLPESPLTSIQTAVGKCQPYRGDVIAVMANGAWTYANPASGYNTPITESVILNVPGVRLVGVFPSGMPGVPWIAAADTEFALTVAAMDCLVEGFAFTGTAAGSNGVYVEWGGATFAYGENATIRTCFFNEDIDIAIQLEYAWYCHIHHNVFDQCDEYGVYIDAASLNGAADNIIEDNLFRDVGIGAISLTAGDRFYVLRNVVFNTDAQNGAAATNEGIDTTGGGLNVVAHNILSCLLPVPANGDYNDFCTAAATDAWIQNYCMDGPSTTNPT